MTIPFTAPFADALAAWRRDRALLFPVAGLLIFLPQYALQLLVPPRPGAAATPDDQAAMQAAIEAMTAWLGQYGGWYVLAVLLAQLGALTVVVLYLQKDKPTLGAALGRAAMLFLRYLLATILVAMPMAGLLSLALVMPLLLIVLPVAAFYIFGRTMLVGPVIVAEAPIGAVAAIVRSWRLTAGCGWMAAAVYAATLLAPVLIGSVVLSIGDLAGTGAMANPVVRAVSAGCAVAIAAVGALTLALVEVSLYRRLARNGT